MEPQDFERRAVEVESTLGTFTTVDGHNLVVQAWPLPHDLAQRGTVLLVHGLGEHVGRYDPVARKLNGWGFCVRGYDQYGHGESEGARGSLPHDERLLDDLADLVDSTRARMDPDTPLLLLGHGMGGVVAARLVSLGLRSVNGLVLSSPAFYPGWSPVQRRLLATLPAFVEDWGVNRHPHAHHHSHDPAVVAAYLADPLVHRRISARLARFVTEAGRAVVAAAPKWRVPTLLLYAGEDRVLDAQGSRDFAAAAPASVVHAHCFDRCYHELFSEPEAAQVFDVLHQWVDTHF